MQEEQRRADVEARRLEVTELATRLEALLGQAQEFDADAQSLIAEAPTDRDEAALEFAIADLARRIERLTVEPEWYNAVTHNCTTSIRLHAIELGIERPWDWRILVNGRGEELLHSRGMVDTSRPFEELRALSDVTELARAAGVAPDFSQRIRADLPPRPLAP